MTNATSRGYTVVETTVYRPASATRHSWEIVTSATAAALADVVATWPAIGDRAFDVLCVAAPRHPHHDVAALDCLNELVIAAPLAAKESRR